MWYGGAGLGEHPDWSHTVDVANAYRRAAPGSPLCVRTESRVGFERERSDARPHPKDPLAVSPGVSTAPAPCRRRRQIECLSS